MIELDSESKEKLASYISVHSKPVQFLIVGILELLKYQKIFIEPSLWEPYIDSLKEMLVKDFEEFKNEKH